MKATEIISSGILELYASGMASDAEMQLVEAWRMQYPEVDAELREIEQALENYARAKAIAPSPSAKEKLFKKINIENAQSETPVVSLSQSNNIQSMAFWKWGFAASVLLLLGSSILNITLYNSTQKTTARLNETQQKLDGELAHSKILSEDLAVVQNKFAKAVSLAGQPVLPDATAKIYWMTNTGDVMVDASNLPEAPSGMQYQFWAIVDGKPINGGLINTNDKGMKYRMQKMKSFGKAEAFAISLEKEGGNPTPTKVVSMGAITNI